MEGISVFWGTGTALWRWVLAVVAKWRSKPCSEAPVCTAHPGEDLPVLVMLVPDEKFKKEKLLEKPSDP